MKSNVSKNARTDRKKNEKLKFNGQEVEPVMVYGHYANMGKFLGVMITSSKKLLKDAFGKPVFWSNLINTI